MKVLVVHNTYQQKGGEDTVFESEVELLKSNSIDVETLLYDNQDIKSSIDKLTTGLFTFYSPSGKKKINRKIEQFQPDIIHVHNFFPLASPAIFFAANQKNIPIVMTLHNYRLICPSAYLFYDGEIYEDNIYKKFPLDPILKGVYRDSVVQTASLVLMTGIHKVFNTWKNRVDKYITLTQFAKEKFIGSSLGAKASQFVVKPNFVNDIGIGNETREGFLFIGRLSEEKGIETLLEAFKKSKASIKILGDGPLKELVLKADEQFKNIEYLGFKPRAEVVETLKSVKALVFTSVWYEGMPMVILEALSVGTPVIASDMGGPAEMIAHMKNGLLFEPGNADTLTKAIEKVESNPELLSSLSEGARDSYLNKYTAETNLKILLDIYQNTISQKKSLS
jgi:glycosyltransferase involved in cell wall biosynthesis